MKNILEIPGRKQEYSNSRILQDGLFFTLAIILPGRFFALIDRAVFIDYRLLYLAVSIPYILLFLKHIKKIYKLPAGKAFIVLNVYLLLQINYSIFIQNIPIIEVITIFRTNFFYPLVALGFLLYASSMNNERLYRFFYWLLLVTFIQDVLVLTSTISGVNFFAVNVKDALLSIENLVVAVFAKPFYNNILFIFAFLMSLSSKSNKLKIFWLLPLTVVFIGDARNQQIVYLLYISFIIIFMKFIPDWRTGIKKSVWAVFIIIFSVIIVLFISPEKSQRLIEKFRLNENTHTESFTKSGTYFFRLSLIEDAYERTEKNGNLWFGNGYIRESTKGSYDFVVGDDTHIPPVLFTEGYMGFIFRLAPILLLLIVNLKYLIWNREKRYKYYALIAVVLILPEFVNIVQTKIFDYYTRTIFILFLLELIKYNDKKEIKLRRIQHVA